MSSSSIETFAALAAVVGLVSTIFWMVVGIRAVRALETFARTTGQLAAALRNAGPRVAAESPREATSDNEPGPVAASESRPVNAAPATWVRCDACHVRQKLYALPGSTVACPTCESPIPNFSERPA